MKRTFALSAVAALLLSACSSAPAKETVRIGYVGPLTGDAVSYGVDTLNGLRIAVDEVNAAGGIGGKQVEIFAEDGRCNGADATSAAQKLVNVDKVVAIIGGQCSSETLALAPVAEAAKVVVISPISSNPDVSKAGDYIFRVYPSDALKGKALAAFFTKNKYKKVAIISENTDFCQGIRGAVKNDLPAGVTMAFDEMVDPGTKDYRTLMTRLKNTDFDVFIANGQSDAIVAEMAKQMRALDMKQQIVGTDVADSATLGQIAKEAVEGLKPLSVPNLSEDTPAAAAFAKTFRAKYGEPKQTMFFASLSHDAARVVLKAIGEVGTGAPLKDALYKVKGYPGISGTFSFDTNGDVIGIPFAMKVFKDGKLMQSEIIPLN